MAHLVMLAIISLALTGVVASPQHYGAHQIGISGSLVNPHVQELEYAQYKKALESKKDRDGKLYCNHKLAYVLDLCEVSEHLCDPDELLERDKFCTTGSYDSENTRKRDLVHYYKQKLFGICRKNLEQLFNKTIYRIGEKNLKLVEDYLSHLPAMRGQNVVGPSLPVDFRGRIYEPTYGDLFRAQKEYLADLNSPIKLYDSPYHPGDNEELDRLRDTVRQVNTYFNIVAKVARNSRKVEAIFGKWLFMKKAVNVYSKYRVGDITPSPSISRLAYPDD